MAKSVLIMTHHKAASTLLRRIVTTCFDPQFTVKDYAGEYWKLQEKQRSWNDVYEMLNSNPHSFFKPVGHIYGPLRLNVDIDTEQFRRVIVVREPVSTIESEYVSFAYTHPVPQAGAARGPFLERRDFLRSIDIDQYATIRTPELAVRYRELQGASSEALVLPYRLLVSDLDEWLREYHSFVGIRYPYLFTKAGVRLRERLSSSGRAIHMSRQQDYKSIKLSSRIRAQVEEEMASYRSLF